MLNGYVGIVSNRGLCQLHVEHRDAIRRAAQAAAVSSKSSPRVGFWAVLPDDTAKHIAFLLNDGESREALRVLNRVAVEGGHLLPAHP